MLCTQAFGQLMSRGGTTGRRVVAQAEVDACLTTGVNAPGDRQTRAGWVPDDTGPAGKYRAADLQRKVWIRGSGDVRDEDQ